MPIIVFFIALERVFLAWASNLLEKDLLYRYFSYLCLWLS